jgi:hypothetical protein
LFFVVPENWYIMDRFQAVQRPSAYALLFALNGWSRQNLSDGFVPSYTVAAVAPLVKANRRLDLAELLRVGLLTNAPGGFEITDFLAWNDSRQDVEARSKAGQIAGLRSAEVRRARRSTERSVEPTVERSVERSVNRERGERESEKEISIKELDLSNEQRADLNFLASTLDVDHRWSTEQLRGKLTELGADGLLRALADEHLTLEGDACAHFGHGSSGQVVVKRSR